MNSSRHNILKNHTFLKFFDSTFWRTILGYLTFHILVKVKGFTGKWGELYTRAKTHKVKLLECKGWIESTQDILKLGNYTFDISNNKKVNILNKVVQTSWPFGTAKLFNISYLDYGGSQNFFHSWKLHLQVLLIVTAAWLQFSRTAQYL